MLPVGFPFHRFNPTELCVPEVTGTCNVKQIIKIFKYSLNWAITLNFSCIWSIDYILALTGIALMN